MRDKKEHRDQETAMHDTISALLEAEPKMQLALRLFKTGFGVGCAVVLLLLYCLYHLPQGVASYYVAVFTLGLALLFLGALLVTSIRYKQALRKLDAWRAQRLEESPLAEQ